MPLTKVTYSMIKGAMVNVLDHGADNTGVSDSTSAIQDAISNSPANAQIYFPVGTYKVSSTIFSSGKSFHLIGDHWGFGIQSNSPAVVIDASSVPAANDVFSFEGEGVESGTIEFSGIRIIGNSTSGAGNVVSVTNIRYFVFRNSAIKYAPHNGLHFVSGCFKAVMSYCYITDCNGNGINNEGTAGDVPLFFMDIDHLNVETCERGISWINDLNPGNGYIRGNNLFALVNRKQGLYVESQGDIQLNQCAFEDNNTTNTTGVANAHFNGCTLVNYVSNWHGTQYEGATLKIEDCERFNIFGGRFDHINPARSVSFSIEMTDSTRMTVTGAFIVSQNIAFSMNNVTHCAINGNVIEAAGQCISFTGLFGASSITGNQFYGGGPVAAIGGQVNIGNDSVVSDNTFYQTTNTRYTVGECGVPYSFVRSVGGIEKLGSFAGADGEAIAFYNGTLGGANASESCAVLRKSGATNRSINAAGTINASGSDYAEYMTKCGEFTLSKGDICGIDAHGMLTNVYSDSVSFVVKSTDPSYVGGDTWFSVNPPSLSEDHSDEDLKKFINEIAEFESQKQQARQKVDRIAFCGQVPVNVTDALPGQYIIPTDDNGLIKGIAVSNPSIDQYMNCIGKVISIGADGRPRIIVKVS